MTKERFFFFLRLTADQKFKVRKNVVLQYMGGKSVARIKSCVPFFIRTIYRWISRFLPEAWKVFGIVKEREDHAQGQTGT